MLPLIYQQIDHDEETYAPALYLEDKGSNFAAELENENYEAQATDNSLLRWIIWMPAAKTLSKPVGWMKPKLQLQDLAAKYNISAERVRQLETNALKKLKTAISV